MKKLFMMDFPVDQVRMTNCYKNESLLAEIRKASPDSQTPPRIKDVFGELYFPPSPRNRPYIFASVVLSSDGKMAFPDSSQGPLIAKKNFFDPSGALADFWMLTALRVYSDAIILGAKTLQVEALNTSHILDNTLAAERISVLGKEPHPLNVVASFDGKDIPLDHMIFHIDPSENFNVFIATSPEGEKYINKDCRKGFPVIRTLEDWKACEPEAGKVPVIVTGAEDKPDSKALLELLKGKGVDRLLLESPSYTAHLLQEKMMDEYFINYSMVFAGGQITPLWNQPFSHENHPHAKLLSLSVHQSSFMYTRQKMYYDVTSQEDLSKYEY